MIIDNNRHSSIIKKKLFLLLIYSINFLKKCKYRGKYIVFSRNSLDYNCFVLYNFNDMSYNVYKVREKLIIFGKTLKQKNISSLYLKWALIRDRNLNRIEWNAM